MFSLFRGAQQLGTARTGLAHLFKRYAFFLRDDGCHQRAAEAALAAPHAGAHTPFDTVHRIAGHRPAQRVQYFSPAHFLAPADDLAVIRVLADERGPRLVRQPRHMRYGPACRVVGGIARGRGCRGKLSIGQPRHLLRDGGRGRQPRRLDARRMDDIFREPFGATDSRSLMKYMIDDMWTPEKGNSAKAPAISFTNKVNNYRDSDLWLRDASYLRLKNVEIGYNFSKKILSKINIGSLRVFATGYNLLTLDKLKIVDPESRPNGNAMYPVVMVINMGLKVGF